MSEARIVTLILLTDIVGKGVKDDPVQSRQSLLTKSGKLIASRTALGDKDFVAGEGWGFIAAEEEP